MDAVTTILSLPRSAMLGMPIQIKKTTGTT
jgi:hypothetical protein